MQISIAHVHFRRFICHCFVTALLWLKERTVSRKPPLSFVPLSCAQNHPGVPALLCRLHVKPNNREALTCCPSASACYPETQLEIGENFNSSVYAQVFGWISSPVSPTVLDLPDYTLFKIKTPKRLLFSKVGGSILLSWALIQNQNTPSILRTYQHLWTSY